MNAYTQRIGFDVLAAPLAEVDRRGLSQAWYSALHLAHDDASHAIPGKGIARPRAAATARAARAPVSTTGGAPQPSTPRPIDREVGRRAAACERRAQATSLARKIERVATTQKAGVPLAAFVLDGKRRVRVAIRTFGARVHVIAVCAPESRARVARALEEVRFALARRGMALDARVRESIR